MNLNGHSFGVSAPRVDEEASHLIQHRYDHFCTLVVNTIKIADTIQNRKIIAMQNYTDEQADALSSQILYVVEHTPHGGWVKKLQAKYPECIDFLDWKYPQLKDRSLKTKIHWLKYGRTDFPVCPTCGRKYGQQFDVNGIDGRYPSHCSCTCTQLDQEVRAKNIVTNMARYGVTNGALAEQARQKRHQTCLDRYGVDNPFKRPDFQARLKQRNLERYGVENVHQRPEVIEKTKQTNLKKYGSVIPGGFHVTVTSKGEKEVCDLCRELYVGTVVANDKTALGGLELDIWFPELRAGIEYDGDFWHNLPAMKKRDKLKDDLCRKKGIRLLRITEGTFRANREMCIEQIKQFLNLKG